MRYCFRSGRFRLNPRTKHISVPPRHMPKSDISDFNMISQHYRYKDTTSHTSGIQVPEYITTAEYTCLSTDYKQCLAAKVKHTEPTSTRVQALRRGPLASHPGEGSSSSTEVQSRRVMCEKREERGELYQNQITNFSPQGEEGGWLRLQPH